MSRKQLYTPVLRTLYAQAGAKCMMCATQVLLLGDNNADDKEMGEVAHIEGLKPGSARYNPNSSDAERDSINNLILLCPNCHTKIDKQPELYTYDKILEIKRSFMAKDKDETSRASANISPEDINEIIDWISKQTSPVTSLGNNLAIIDADAKILKNGLTEYAKSYIQIGLANQATVEKYIETKAKLDPNYPNRLKKAFKDEYNRLVAESNSGDALFYELLLFAESGHRNLAHKAAALAVIAHLFLICELFEL